MKPSTWLQSQRCSLYTDMFHNDSAHMKHVKRYTLIILYNRVCDKGFFALRLSDNRNLGEEYNKQFTNFALYQCFKDRNFKTDQALSLSL